MEPDATEIGNRLKNIYYNLESSASYSTVEKLYQAVNKEISKEKIKKWLRGELAYTLHKPRRINFKRNFYEIYSINEMFQADLIDLVSLGDQNDGYKYLLLVIDCLSRFVRVRPLKSKTAKEALVAFKSIFDEIDFTPSYLLTDREKAFFSNILQNYFKSIKVNHYAPSNDSYKAAFAERLV